MTARRDLLVQREQSERPAQLEQREQMERPAQREQLAQRVRQVPQGLRVQERLSRLHQGFQFP